MFETDGLMPRQKKDRLLWQHRFNLSSDNPDDVRLHEFLLSLANDGEAAAWIRQVLNSVVQQEYNDSTAVVPRNEAPVIPPEEVSNGAARPMGLNAAMALAAQRATNKGKGLPRNGKRGDSNEG